jgi:hypothetical protein
MSPGPSAALVHSLGHCDPAQEGIFADLVKLRSRPIKIGLKRAPLNYLSHGNEICGEGLTYRQMPFGPGPRGILHPR